MKIKNSGIAVSSLVNNNDQDDGKAGKSPASNTNKKSSYNSNAISPKNKNNTSKNLLDDSFPSNAGGVSNIVDVARA